MDDVEFHSYISSVAIMTIKRDDSHTGFVYTPDI